MISEGQFAGQIEQLEASFARSLPAKVKDGWFKEVENCDFRIFKVAMRKLMIGDKFPNFGYFWVQYNLAKQDIQGVDEIERGCKGCRHGFIHYRIFDKVLDQKVDYTGYCKNCWPERKKGTMKPNGAYDYQPGMEPWHVQHNKPIPTVTAKGMIQDLVDKITKRSIDWEQETKDAWDFHERITGK